MLLLFIEGKKNTLTAVLISIFRTMSLRPRPVTATVTKPKWMEPEVYRPRSRSMESNGSTASLTSVLDHDSYESLADTDDDLDTEITEQHSKADIDSRLHERLQRKWYEYRFHRFVQNMVLKVVSSFSNL